MGLRVGVCEDDHFTRSMLTAALEQAGIDVALAAPSASHALEQLSSATNVQAFIIDLHLGDGPNGLDLARAIRRGRPEVAFVFLSSFEDPQLLELEFLGLPTGSQYVVKSSVNSIDQLIKAVYAACERKRDDAVSGGLTSELTQKQISVLALISRGLSNSEIAKELEVSEDTIEGVVRRTAKRLGISREQSTNQRVLMVRAYLKAIGGLR
jgi:DNA-binding NarL/FixJ family response regulator